MAKSKQLIVCKYICISTFIYMCIFAVVIVVVAANKQTNEAMAKLNETKIPITDFLEAYRRQPCLYNSLLETYKNRVAREEAYEAIIKSLNIPHLTVLDIKLKIKSVRTVYTKELRILMRKKEQNQCYEPKLFWFKRADSFLRSVSLSHCKRLKSKNSNGNETSSVAIKKEATQKMLVNAPSESMEDAMRTEEDESDTEAGRLDDSLDERGSKSVNVGTSNNASSQTPDDARSSKTELGIDDAAAGAAICMMEQQHQQQQQQHHQLQQQTIQRKFKYMPYIQQQQQHQQQQQQHRLSTPFPSPSPSQQTMEMTPASTPSAHCFAAAPNGISAGNAEDDLVIFGQSIASQLRAIPDPYSRSVAKLRIQQVLFEAETGQSSEAVSPHLQSF